MWEDPEIAIVEVNYEVVNFRVASGSFVRSWEWNEDTFETLHPVAGRDGTKLGPSRDQVRILDKCLYDSAIGELLAIAGRTNRTKFRDQVINPLIDAGLIEMTIPEKPRSSKQRYRTTAAGRSVLENSEKEPQP